MKIEPNSFYITRGGGLVHIRHLFEESAPYVAVGQVIGREILRSWTASGTHALGRSQHDLQYQVPDLLRYLCAS